MLLLLLDDRGCNAAFAIGQNSYSKFLADAGLHDARLTVETTSRIFVEVNVETQKGTIEADLNEDRGLRASSCSRPSSARRGDQVEIAARVATTMRPHIPAPLSPSRYEGQIADVSDAVAKFVAEDLGPKLPKVATFDRDDFRRDRCTTARPTGCCARTSRRSRRCTRCTARARAASRRSTSARCAALLSDLAFLAWDIHCLSLPKVRLAFFNSRMVVVDEIVLLLLLLLLLRLIEFVPQVRLAFGESPIVDERADRRGPRQARRREFVDLDRVALDESRREPALAAAREARLSLLLLLIPLILRDYLSHSYYSYAPAY